MFQKRKEARAQKKNKDVTELVASQETFLEQLDEQLTVAAAATDAAEKILKLQETIRHAERLDEWARGERKSIAAHRADKKAYKISGTGATLGVAGAVTSAVIMTGGLASLPALLAIGLMAGTSPGAFARNRIDKTKSKQLTEQNPAVADYASTLAARKTRAQELLDETVKSFSFAEASLSPHLNEALDEYNPFRNAFAKAAAETAQQVLEEKAAAKQAALETIKAQRKPGSPHRLRVTR